MFRAEPVGSRWYLLASILKRVVLLISSRRFSSARITGASAAGNGQAEALYLGEGESLGYLAGLCGRGVPETRPTTLREVLSRSRQRRPRETVVVELSRLLTPLVPAGGYRTLPWIRQKIDLRPEAASSGGRAIEGTYGRRVRRHGYTRHIIDSPQAADAFYRDQYLPYTERRHGPGAHPRSLHEIRRAVDRGFLLQVLDGDRWISGVACRLQGREVTALAYGLSEPHDELLRRGALSATTYFLLQWAKENGMRSVDLLRSRPHAEDGVYEHKRRFGAEPVHDSWPHTAIWVFPPAADPPCPPLSRLLVQAGHSFRPLESLVEPTESGG